MFFVSLFCILDVTAAAQWATLQHAQVAPQKLICQMILG